MVAVGLDKIYIMKKFCFLLLCAMLTCSFTSCSDDEDEIVITQELLVGTWDVVWADMDGQSGDIPYGTIYITLYNNGTYQTKFPTLDYVYEGNYELRNNTVIGTTTNSPVPFVENYTFTSLSGNNAGIHYSLGEEYTFRAEKR